MSTATPITDEIMLMAYRVRPDGQSDPVTGDDAELAAWLLSQMPNLRHLPGTQGDRHAVLGWSLTRVTYPEGSGIENP